MIDAAGHELVNSSHGIPVARIDDLRGAELTGELELRGHHVDRHDRRGAGDARPLDDIQADASAPDDRNRVPWANVRRVQCRANPRHHGAAHERQLGKREVGSTLIAVRAGTTDRSANDDVL